MVGGYVPVSPVIAHFLFSWERGWKSEQGQQGSGAITWLVRRALVAIPMVLGDFLDASGRCLSLHGIKRICVESLRMIYRRHHSHRWCQVNCNSHQHIFSENDVILPSCSLLEYPIVTTTHPWQQLYSLSRCCWRWNIQERVLWIQYNKTYWALAERLVTCFDRANTC